MPRSLCHRSTEFGPRELCLLLPAAFISPQTKGKSPAPSKHPRSEPCPRLRAGKRSAQAASSYALSIPRVRFKKHFLNSERVSLRFVAGFVVADSLMVGAAPDELPEQNGQKQPILIKLL